MSKMRAAARAQVRDEVDMRTTIRVSEVPRAGQAMSLLRSGRSRVLALALTTLSSGQAFAATNAAISADRASFNPSRGESVGLRLAAAGSVGVKVSIYDADGGLVRTLMVSRGEGEKGKPLSWGGRDESGRPVPDEAYTLVVKRADGIIYDPTTFSGGVVGDIRDATFDDSGTVSYKLPAPSRVLIRLGLHNGPMYRTLVDWEPRPAGKVIEHWDGFDADGLVKLRGHEDFTALITYVALPEATVITYGNEAESYREYKLGRGKDRPQKPEPPEDFEAGAEFRPTSLLPPAWARAPQVAMSFPDLLDGDTVPAVDRFVNVRIDVADEDKPLLMEDQFEVLLFVDGQFFAEAERGYLPLNWKWELDQFQPGEHILTANISSFRGQVGVASRKILLEP